jgi:hypothetical protein
MEAFISLEFLKLARKVNRVESVGFFFLNYLGVKYLALLKYLLPF